MKKNKSISSQNRTEDFYKGEGKLSNKKKSKVDVSRFISEGNPNTQAVRENEKDKPKWQDIEQQDDLS